MQNGFSNFHTEKLGFFTSFSSLKPAIWNSSFIALSKPRVGGFFCNQGGNYILIQKSVNGKMYNNAGSVSANEQ